MIMGFFGLPGCGKSTFLAQIAKKYQQKGIKTYCLSSYPVDGCYLLDFDDLGKYHIENGLILIDEISLCADNRNYKEFKNSIKQFFILHRHYNCDIYWFTQQYDGVDRKIRELTTCLYYIRSFGTYSLAVRINRFIHVDKEIKEIKVGYKMSSLLSRLFAFSNKSMRFVYRPKYYAFFNSFEAPKLPDKEFPLFKVSEGLKGS